MPPPQPYPGMYYQPMAPEHLLSRRNVWTMNAIGIGAIWLAFIFRLITADPNVFKFSQFLIFTGGFLGVLASTAAALGSKKTTDLQNLGLLVWAGFLVTFVAAALTALPFL